MSKPFWCPPRGPLRVAAVVLGTTLGLGAGLGPLGLGPLGVVAAHAAPVSPDGLWFTDEKESVIRVQPCQDDAEAHCGSIAWLKQPNDADGAPKRDKNNPDPDKASQTLLGLEILRHLSADDDHWTGKAYNPEDGKTYDITFKVVHEDGEDHADLRGCVLRVLCRTKSLARATALPGTPAVDPHKHKPGKKASGTP